MITLSEQLAFARRVLRARQDPVWSAKQPDAAKVKHGTDCLQAICATLERQVLLEEISNEMKSKIPVSNAGLTS